VFCRREAETECAARGDVGIRALPKRSRSDKLEDALDTQVRVGIRVLPERSRNAHIPTVTTEGPCEIFLPVGIRALPERSRNLKHQFELRKLPKAGESVFCRREAEMRVGLEDTMCKWECGNPCSAGETQKWVR